MNREPYQYKVNDNCPSCDSNHLKTVVTSEQFGWEQNIREKEKLGYYKTDRPMLTYVQYYPTEIDQCQDCSLGFRRVVPIVDDLRKAYTEDPMPENYVESWEKSWTPIFSYLLNKLNREQPRKGKLLDIGSQFGLFPLLAEKSGWDASGLYPNKYTVLRGLKRRVNMYQGLFSDVDLPPNHFDAVTAWLVYENLPSFFEETRKVKDILQDGGVFALKVSNFDFYKNMRFLLKAQAGRTIFSRLHIMGYPYQFGFTPRSLRDVFHRAGFSQVDISNYHLHTSLNPDLKLSVQRLEKVSKDAINTISGSVEIASGRRNIIGPWLEVYARK